MYMKRFPHTSGNQPQPKPTETWQQERTKEIMIAMGRVTAFQVSDIDADHLREVVANIEQSRCMRDADFSITQENHCSAQRTGNGLISDEVMK
jgi:hypothetical protein